MSPEIQKQIAERWVAAVEAKPLLKLVDTPPSNRTVDVIDENNRWRFAPSVSSNNHFWSTDGAECLWCAQQRTPKQIAAWFASGKPDEVCGI